MKKVFLKYFVKFSGKYLYRSLLFNKVAGCKLKKRLRCWFFSVNFEKISKTTFLQNPYEQLFPTSPHRYLENSSLVISSVRSTLERWSVVAKIVNRYNPYYFCRKTLLQMFDRVLNTPVQPAFYIFHLLCLLTLMNLVQLLSKSY